jgi:hypothetical protein
MDRIDSSDLPDGIKPTRYSAASRGEAGVLKIWFIGWAIVWAAVALFVMFAVFGMIYQFSTVVNSTD